MGYYTKVESTQNITAIDIKCSVSCWMRFPLSVLISRSAGALRFSSKIGEDAELDEITSLEVPLLKVMQEHIRVTTKDFGELFALDEAESFGLKPELYSTHKPLVCDPWLLLHVGRSVVWMVHVEGRTISRCVILIIL